MHPTVLNKLLKSIAIKEVWGIGSQLSKQLQKIEILSAFDLKHAHRQTMIATFSVVMGRIIEELNGVPCIALEEVSPVKQNIASTRSFGVPVTAYQSLAESLSLYASRAAEKARAQNTYACSMTAFIQTSPFAESPYYNGCLTAPLPMPANYTPVLVRCALWILKRIYREGYVYQKAGVILNDLVPEEGVRRDLFQDLKSVRYAKNQQIMQTLDAIYDRFGRQTLKLASEGFKAPWKMKQERKSPGYTTDWQGLIKIR